MTFLAVVKIHTYSFYHITSNCKVFEFAQQQSITLRQRLNGNSGQLRTLILTLGKTVKLQALNKLLMIVLNC